MRSASSSRSAARIPTNRALQRALVMKKPPQLQSSTLSHSWIGVQSAIVAGAWQTREGP
jgi:hypothetical protein